MLEIELGMCCNILLDNPGIKSSTCFQPYKAFKADRDNPNFNGYKK